MKTSKKIIKWAMDKDIISPENVHNQFKKLKEEVGELGVEINEGNNEKARMELGDCEVVLEILANQLGTSASECKKLAYEKIKNRTGKKINGTFVKD